MGRYFLYDHRVLNAGNHVEGAAAFTVRFDVNIESPSS
jgi:hypothetical protein